MDVKSNTRRLVCGLLLVVCLPVNSALANEKQLAMQSKFVGLMQNFLQVIETTHGIYSDSEKAAIFQLHKIQETYKKKGEPQKAIEVFQHTLKTSQNNAIRNATYTMLADTLKDAGNFDEAVKVLRSGLDENIASAK